ncbi:MAG: response regulator [Elusimicrobia bacterium]|nr:response regulator [Candidatus Obscuribacterium magneticum]
MKKKAYGTYDIAKICHVMPATIGRWIEEGKLPSFTTGGGHRRVWDNDLLAFLKKHNIPVPDELKSGELVDILIVDDEPSIRRVVTRLVKKIYPQAALHEAKDGYEAGHKIGSLKPDLVLLDLRLPGIDGIKVCQMVRQDKNLKTVKILVMSGYSVDQCKKKALDAGADDFIAKPFEAEELTSKITRLLS